MSTNKDITLYLGNRNPPPVVNVSQGDTDWLYRFTVMYNNAVYAPTVNYVILTGHKPDGHVFMYRGAKSGNLYTVTPSNANDNLVQMTAIPGDVRCELRLISSSRSVGTLNFILRVEPGPEGVVTVASVSALSAYVTILQELGVLIGKAETLPDDVPGWIGDWLEAHISGGQGVAVDNTLTVQGAAADSKAVGDAISTVTGPFADAVTYRGALTSASVLNDLRTPGYYYVPGGLGLSDAPDDSPARLVVLNNDGANAGLVHVWFDLVEPRVYLRTARTTALGWSDWSVLFDDNTFFQRRRSAAAEDDVDDFLLPGSYYIRGGLGLAHAPNDNPARLVVLSPGDATAGMVQVWFDMIVPAVFYRFRRTETWSDWYSMFDNTSFYMNRGAIEQGQNVDGLALPGNYYATANAGVFNSASPFYPGRLDVITDSDANAALVHDWTDAERNRRYIKSKRSAATPWSDWRELVSRPHSPSRFAERYQAFLAAMRAKAARIGMSDSTVITSTNGAASTTSTARDLMRLLIACSGCAELLKVSNLPRATISIRGVQIAGELDLRSLRTMPDYPYDQTTGEVDGVTWTDNGDRSITASGTASEDSAFWVENRVLADDSLRLEAGMTYRLSGCPAGGSMNTYLLRASLFPSADSTAGGIYYNDLGNGVMFTVPETGDYYVNIHAEIAAGATVNGITFRPLLERVEQIASTIIVQEGDPDHTEAEISASQALQQAYFMVLGKTGTNASENLTPGGESANHAINLAGVYDTPAGPVCAVVLGATSKANRFTAIKKLLDIASGASSDAAISTCYAAIACKLPAFNGSAVCGYEPEVLFQQNADVLCETQSTIKLLTALTFLDYPVEMDDWHSVLAGEITGGSGEGILRVGDAIRPRDALTSMLLISHNTASKVLASVAGEYIIDHL